MKILTIILSQIMLILCSQKFIKIILKKNDLINKEKILENISILELVYQQNIQNRKRKQIHHSFYKNQSGYIQKNNYKYQTLLKDFYNTQYIGEMYLGSEKQKFTVIFDTGSSWIWVASNTCSECKMAKKFNEQSSSSLQQTNFKVSITYGKGQVTGQVMKDEIALSSQLIASNQPFLDITKATMFPTIYFDGLIGLGSRELSENFSTFIDTLKQQGKIEKRVFSIFLQKLTKNEQNSNKSLLPSTLIIGGSLKYYKGEKNFHYCPLIQQSYYSIELTNLQFKFKNGKNYHIQQSTQFAIIDSGTSLISFPSFEFEQFKELLLSNGLKCYFIQRVNQIICIKSLDSTIKQFPVMKISFCGKTFILEAEDYIQENRKYFIIQISQLDLPVPHIIFGDLFMQKFYVEFDEDLKRIGIMKAQIYNKIQ